jgi:hypothetical protein
MAGETDLGLLLASMRPIVRSGEFVFVTLPARSDAPTLAIVHEDEGVTHVVERATADARGWSYDFVAAWITLRVHSSLAAVGLTAAVSRALADQGISCNFLSGFYHDHLLVPVERTSEAMAALHDLALGLDTSPGRRVSLQG